MGLGACKKADQPAKGEPKATAAQPVATGESAQAPSGGDKGVLLQVKWPVGNRYVYRLDMDQHVTNRVPPMPKPIEQDVTIAMTYALSVTKELPAGGHEVELEFLANEMEIKMGPQVLVSFDSKEAGKNDSPLIAPFRKMIGSKLPLQLNAQGDIDKLIGLDEWQKSLSGGQPSPAGAMLAQQFGESFFRQILSSSRGFPEKPVQIGETWPYQTDLPAGQLGKVTVDMKITFTGWEQRDQHHCAALQTEGSFKSSTPIPAGQMGTMMLEDGRGGGRSWFDPQLGALVESASDQFLRLRGEVPNQLPGGNRPPTAFTIELGQKVNLKLVELREAKK